MERKAAGLPPFIEFVIRAEATDSVWPIAFYKTAALSPAACHCVKWPVSLLD